MATDGTLSWTFQNTGFLGGVDWQTALAMRDGDTWPVIFSVSNNSNYNGVQAYSLYPVLNQQTDTNWWQIGTNLLPCNGGSATLSAATSPTGSFAAVVRTSGDTNPWDNTAVIGSSANGFGPVMSGVRAIGFGSTGTPIFGTQSAVPSMQPLASVAAMPNGDVAALDEGGNYYQQSNLLGGWQYQKNVTPPTPFAALAVDTLNRPHIISNFGGEGGLVASDFNVMTGQWTSQTLCSMPFVDEQPAIAADGLGGVGAAWVQANPANPSTVALEYAYNNGASGWVLHTVTTSVFNTAASTYENVMPSLDVGLAFDANNFPVISFEAGKGQIWLAYDPVTVPEPSTLALLGIGAVSLLAYAWRKRWMA
jgi:hypothetical protein